MMTSFMLFMVGLFGGLMVTIGIQRRKNGGHRKTEKNEAFESFDF